MPTFERLDRGHKALAIQGVRRSAAYFTGDNVSHFIMEGGIWGRGYSVLLMIIVAMRTRLTIRKNIYTLEIFQEKNIQV